MNGVGIIDNGVVIVDGMQIAAFVQEMHGTAPGKRRLLIEQIVEDFLVWRLRKNGPAEAATSPDLGSNPSQKGNENVGTDTIHSLKLAMGSLDHAESFIHAAWMAARSLTGDDRPAGEALEAVIHMAGEALGDVRNQLRKAGAA